MDTSLLLNITKDNLAEAQFMSSSFIDAEVKNRAFLNTLGAEIAADYLSYNGLLRDNLKNVHSIKKVLGKTDIADIILSNVHIDVRVVFDENAIFIPKSHFELNIAPDVYMILKFNNNYDNVEFLGFIETSEIKFDKSNEDYYFIESTDLKSPEEFIECINHFENDKEEFLSQDEILRGRELSVALSDDDISEKDYKEFLKLLLSSSLLRDSVLEYDNFEALAGQVADYIVKNSGTIDSNVSLEDESTDGNTENNLEISDSIMDFIEPELKSENTISNSITDSAIELAGLSGETDDMSEANDLIDVVEDNIHPDDSESGQQDISNFDVAGMDIGISNQNQEDLNDSSQSDIQSNAWSDDKTSDNVIYSSNSEFTLENISLDQNDLLSDIGDISADDLLSLDGPSESEKPVFQDVDLKKIENPSDMETVSDYSGGNTAVSSYEEYDPMLDEKSSGMYDGISQENNYENVESYDFGDLEESPLEVDTQDSSSSHELYDLGNEVQNDEPVPDFENEQESAKEISDMPDISNNEESDESWTASEETWEADPDGIEDEEIQKSEEFEGFGDFSNDPDLSDNVENLEENSSENEDISSQEFENYDYNDYNEGDPDQNYEYDSAEDGNEVLITDEVINNSQVIENSTIISDRNFEPGEIFLDINNQVLPDMGDGDIGNLYDNNEFNDQQSGLNNDVRIGKLPQISPKFGAIGLLLITAVAGVIIFSVSKIMKPSPDVVQPQPQPGSLNPEKDTNADTSKDNLNINRDKVVMEDEKDKIQDTQTPRRHKPSAESQKPVNIAPALKPIPPTAFLSIKKLSWEVPDYISYNAEFRQFFQSSGKSLKAALSSDLLLATDYAYTNVINLSITFSKDGRFKDAKVVSSSGSTQIDKIVLQSVNQTLNLMKAPNSLQNDENTTVILKIYL